MRATTFALTILILTLGFAALARLWWIWNFNQARRKGKIPARDRATMFDVRRLLQEGKKEEAVQLYSEIFHTGYSRARRDVEQLERSLKS